MLNFITNYSNDFGDLVKIVCEMRNTSSRRLAPQTEKNFLLEYKRMVRNTPDPFKRYLLNNSVARTYKLQNIYSYYLLCSELFIAQSVAAMSLTNTRKLSKPQTITYGYDYVKFEITATTNHSTRVWYRALIALVIPFFSLSSLKNTVSSSDS